MILLYHKLFDNPTKKKPPSCWWVENLTFQKQIETLLSADYNPVYLNDYKPGEKNFCITFDGVYENIFPSVNWCCTLKVPVELFIIGDYIGKSNEFDSPEPLANFATEKQLLDVADKGARIQWHSMSHKNKYPEDMELEWEMHFDDGEMSWEHFQWYAYPHSKQELRGLVEKKFVGALACENGNFKDKYAWPRITMKEKTRCL